MFWIVLPDMDATAGLIIPLATRSLPDIGQVGGKGLGLIRLRRLGLTVPRGFCVAAAAYRAHLEQHGIRQQIDSRLRRGRSLHARFLAAVRRSVIDAQLDASLLDALRGQYDRLAAARVAVRSSATAEDLHDRSFAGQYETFLGIDTFPGLPEAVKQCWAAFWSERAFRYRQAHGLGHLEHAMAVLVQEMIEGSFSGVAFTVDPRTGFRGSVIIESCRGIGAALVSGKVEPDRIIIDRRRMRIKESAVAARKVRAVKENGLRPPTIEESETSTLDAGRARSVARIALKIERDWNAPVDVEWTLKGETIHVLQARPVTTAKPVLPFEDRQVWTDANTGEVLPDVVTPLTWSVADPIVLAIFNSALSVIGADLKENTVCGLICGRVYFNINMIAGLLRNIPGFKRLDINTIFGGAQAAMKDIKVTEQDIPVIRIRLSDAALAMPIRLTRLVTLLFADHLKFLGELKRRIEPFERLDYRARSDRGLMAAWQGLISRMCHGLQNSGYAGMAMLFYPILDRFCQKSLGSKPGVMVGQLLAGLGDVDSAASGLALYDLARTARDRPSLARIIRHGGKWHRVKTRLARVEGGLLFLRAWDRFMAEHGHHTRGEIELSRPRWSEQPDYILGMVRTYLSARPEDDAVEHYQRIVARRHELTRECRARLRDPWRRMLFDFYLTRAQRGCIVRENLKNTLVKGMRVVRQMALETGLRLRSRGIIRRADDIFFLTAQELHEALVGAKPVRVGEVIARRRAEYRRNLKIRPPHVIQGRFDPKNYRPRAFNRSTRVLKGLAVSPGAVRGRARVVRDTGSRERVLPGEILVAPFTDPGWAPYFMSAAAIVVDMGGLLSHGSIVAREYGIPAVVNVGPATRIIKTGQLLEVDGDQGLVTILRAGD